MKTSTWRTLGMILSAGVLLTSCVSSKKYHASQAEVARLKADSTTLAQDASNLHQNITSMEQKNSELQKTLETSNSTNAGLQKNVAYYHDYFDKQTAAVTQVNDELKTSLAPSGLTDQDIRQVDGVIYVNIGEKSLFKGKTAILSAKGKDLVNSLGQFVKSHETVDISVADLEQSNSSVVANSDGSTSMSQGTTATASSANTDANTDKKIYTKTRPTTDKTYHKSVVHHARKSPTAVGEKSMTFSSRKNYSSMHRSMARAMAWRRQNVVADELLRNGLPKVKLVSQNQPMSSDNSAAKGVQVVLTQDVGNFYKKMSEVQAGQPVGKNP